MPPSAASQEELPDGRVASAARPLPAGTRLNEFELGETLGEDGTAIVYAATDRARGVPVAIAEYTPARLAQRKDEAQVAPRTPLQADAFARGLRAFVNEARTLARCNHPSLIRIACLFEANATAYCVTPRYAGRRLLDVRQAMNQPPDEEALRALLGALLGALEAFHRSGGCHGKVTPSNILLLDDNRPLLLGPDAAGRAIASDAIDALVTSREPCFAPIEQIVEADARLHPSIDLYALAGVARFWMSGQLPPPAFGAPGTARRETVAHTVQRLRSTWPRLRYSASLVTALDGALSIYPAERPQSVAEMRARLELAGPTPERPASAARTAAPAPSEAVPSSQATTPQHALSTVVPQEIDAAKASAPETERRRTSGPPQVDNVEPVRPAFAQPPNRRIAMWSGALLTLLALLLAGVPELRQEREVGRVLDFLGIGRGADAPLSAAAPASAAGAPAPVTPSIAANEAAAKPMPTGPNAARSPEASQAAGSPSAAARAIPPVAADSEVAKPTPAQQDASGSPTGVIASDFPASTGGTTLAATDTAGPPPQSPPMPVHATKQAASHGPASPREACGVRTQFSMYRCMQLQCAQPRWATNAQCEHLRKTDSVD